MFLDVDGVVLVGDDRAARAATWIRRRVWLESHGVAVVVYFSERVLRDLRKLVGLPGVEFRWLTSWQQDAPEALGPVIGLGASWRSCAAGPGSAGEPTLDWWKATFVRKAVESGKRVVWVDDDISRWISLVREYGDGMSLDWIDQPSLLCVCPSPTYGLNAKDLREMECFILGG